MFFVFVDFQNSLRIGFVFVLTKGDFPWDVQKEEKQFNAPWFENNKTKWVNEWIPLISKQMIPLERQGYVLSERWGAYYHVFGLFAFGLHEMALFGKEIGTDLDKFVVLMNQILNPFLAGGKENPVKHEIDKQAVDIIFGVVQNAGRNVMPHNCDNSKGYVLQ